MRSAGNDIVSLSSVNSQRTLQPNYYTRVLSASEKKRYDSIRFNIPFDEFIWMSWAVKEAAYKFLKRNHSALEFSPTRLEVVQCHEPDNGVMPEADCRVFSNKDQPSYSGTVTCGELGILYFRAVRTRDWIAAVVNGVNEFSRIVWHVDEIENESRATQSARVRELLLRALGERYPGMLTIEKTAGDYPVLHQNSHPVDLPISFAHHGRYVSFVVM